jgi:hypothetical protein
MAQRYYHLKIWRRAVIAALWMIGPVLMGFLAAMISGEHGSVVFVVVGLYVGVSGAVSYLLLPLVPPLRRLGAIGRTASIAAGAALPTIAFSAYFALSGSSPWFFNFEAGLAVAYACICALLISQVEFRWRSEQPGSSRFF